MQVLLQPFLLRCRSSSLANSSALTAASTAKCYKCTTGALNILWYLPSQGAVCAHRGMGYFQHSNKAQPGTFSCAGASECLSLVTQTAQSAGACPGCARPVFEGRNLKGK